MSYLNGQAPMKPNNNTGIKLRNKIKNVTAHPEKTFTDLGMHIDQRYFLGDFI